MPSWNTPPEGVYPAATGVAFHGEQPRGPFPGNQVAEATQQAISQVAGVMKQQQYDNIANKLLAVPSDSADYENQVNQAIMAGHLQGQDAMNIRDELLKQHYNNVLLQAHAHYFNNPPSQANLVWDPTAGGMVPPGEHARITQGNTRIGQADLREEDKPPVYDPDQKLQFDRQTAAADAARAEVRKITDQHGFTPEEIGNVTPEKYIVSDPKMGTQEDSPVATLPVTKPGMLYGTNTENVPLEVGQELNQEQAVGMMNKAVGVDAVTADGRRIPLAGLYKAQNLSKTLPPYPAALKPLARARSQAADAQPGKQQIDPATAKTFLEAAGGDKNKARAAAKAAGYEF